MACRDALRRMLSIALTARTSRLAHGALPCSQPALRGDEAQGLSLRRLAAARMGGDLKSIATMPPSAEVASVPRSRVKVFRQAVGSGIAHLESPRFVFRDVRKATLKPGTRQTTARAAQESVAVQSGPDVETESRYVPEAAERNKPPRTIGSRARGCLIGGVSSPTVIVMAINIASRAYTAQSRRICISERARTRVPAAEYASRAETARINLIARRRCATIGCSA